MEGSKHPLADSLKCENLLFYDDFIVNYPLLLGILDLNHLPRMTLSLQK